jgi:hypothetical protein
LKNLGPSLDRWRSRWTELVAQNPDRALDLSADRIKPIGYVVMRPPKAYQRWIDRFPAAYRQSVLQTSPASVPATADDPWCLAMLKHYRSLMPMAMEARKPVFALKPADGAIGAHVEAAKNAYADFLSLAHRIANRTGNRLS